MVDLIHLGLHTAVDLEINLKAVVSMSLKRPIILVKGTMGSIPAVLLHSKKRAKAKESRKILLY